MSLFNPQVPEASVNDPNYFHYSEPIKNLKVDESTGMSLSTLGKGIEGVGELADSAVKASIKTDVYNRTDPLVNKYIDALADIRNDPTGTGKNSPLGNDPANTVVEGTPGPPVDIMGNTSPENIPAGVSNSVARIQQLGAAQASGKPSETLFNQRLWAELKDVRSEYPGWRDYVDQEMKKATGRDVANDLVASMRDDIAKQGTNQQKERDFWRSKIVDNPGFPNADKVLQKFEQDGDHTFVMKWLSTNQAPIEALKLKKSIAESTDQDAATTLKTNTDFAQSAANHAATIFFTNQKLFGGKSPSDISDAMLDLTLHPEKGNDVAYQNLGAQYKAMEAAAITHTTMILNQRSKGPDGKLLPSVADNIGPEAVTKIVNNSVGSLFRATSNMISDKQFSGAYSVQQQAEAMQNNALMKVLSNPTIGGTVQTASVVNKLIPQLSPQLIGQMLGDGIDQNFKPLAIEIGKQAVANTGGSYQGIDGKIYTFKQSLEELAKAGTINGSPAPGQVYNNLLNITKVITDPTADPKAKANAINYFYDPVNKGTMKTFMDDYYDPTKGGMIKGKSSAFAALTSDDVTKAVRAQGDMAWMKYSGWAKGEFQQQLQTSVKDLNDMQTSEHFHFGWDKDTHQLSILNADGSPLSGLQATSVNLPYRTVQNLNMGLRNMANIAKTEGSNVDAYLFKVLKDAGYTPTKDIEGVPANIMKSLMVGNGLKVKDTPAVPISKFAAEEPRGNLQDFLTNPTGRPQDVALEPQQTRGVIKGNLSDETLLNMKTDDIPEGMSARDLIRQLQSR